MHLFSRNVLALDTFFPIAEAFQEKYEPEGSTCSVKPMVEDKSALYKIRYHKQSSIKRISNKASWKSVN